MLPRHGAARSEQLELLAVDHFQAGGVGVARAAVVVGRPAMGAPVLLAIKLDTVLAAEPQLETPPLFPELFSHSEPHGPIMTRLEPPAKRGI